MSDTIQETIQAVLQNNGQGSYMTYAAPVVQALKAREQEISQKLIDYADSSDIGYSPEQVRDLLTEIGLEVPEEEPAPDINAATEEGSGQLTRIEELLGGIARQVESLTHFARANGYRG